MFFTVLRFSELSILYCYCDQHISSSHFVVVVSTKDADAKFVMTINTSTESSFNSSEPVSFTFSNGRIFSVKRQQSGGMSERWDNSFFTITQYRNSFCEV